MSINYWRTIDKAEVDFVVEDERGGVFPVEVKYGSTRRPEVTRSLRSIIENTSLKKCEWWT